MRRLEKATFQRLKITQRFPLRLRGFLRSKPVFRLEDLKLEAKQLTSKFICWPEVEVRLMNKFLLLNP